MHFYRQRVPSFPKAKVMHRFHVYTLLVLIFVQTITQAQEPLTRIAFGSCCKQDKPQPIWESIVAKNPQLFLFLGDNIYGDTEDMKVLKAKWDMLANQAGYKKLKEKCQVLATWDDHDYGANDAGAEYPRKKESQQIFQDFLGVTKDSPRRKQEGVYHSEIIGPVGKRVQVILLDVRYFRSPLKTGYKPGEPGDGYRGKYAPETNPSATVLGETQWKWLEEQLKKPAELRLVCSGVQVIPDEHGSEMWGNFPLEREKLFKLIASTKANNVLLLSGDRHLAEIMKLPAKTHGIAHPLYEITSSSLNTPSGNLTKAGTRFSNEINSYRMGLTYFETNFGIVEIDWNQSPPLVRGQVCDEAGAVVLQQKILLTK
jgi:alkaline phosphatase D